jgi:hypothetical protein
VPPPPLHAASQDKTLRALFLTIFLRGHSSRGLTKASAPKSIGQRLALVLISYGVLGGFMPLFLFHQSTILISALMHAFTFMALGMFITSSAGETLFNKEETEILMHRPIKPKTLLWAKVWVMAQVSLYLAVAMNLASFAVGIFASDGSGSKITIDPSLGISLVGPWYLYPIIHFVSITESALFTTGFVVLSYQLCLKWFGRDKLEGMMTAVQIVATVGMILGSQILPRAMIHAQGLGVVIQKPMWIYAIPSTWFACLDDAIAGSHEMLSWGFAALGLAVTVLVLRLALGKLAASYESGVQVLNESAAPKASQRSQLGFLKKVAAAPPFSWFLGGSVEKATFVLACAYIFRDRETKLRIFPGIVPMVIMPIVFTVTNPGMSSELHSPGTKAITDSFMPMMVSISGGYLSCIPLLALNLLSFTQQWKASELFRLTPIRGPWAIQRGAQVAVMVIFVLPIVLADAIYTCFIPGIHFLPLLLPAVMLLPVYALLPALITGSVPLSMPTEEAKAAGRGFVIMFAMFAGIGIGVASAIAWRFGFFWYLTCLEAVVVSIFCLLADRHLRGVRWKSAE